jgi:hypothetical protein
MTRRRIGPAAPHFDIEAAFDVLREFISRTDALVHATEYQLERFTWRDEDREEAEDERRLEHLAHLLGAAKEAASAAVIAGDEIAAALAKHRVCA